MNAKETKIPATKQLTRVPRHLQLSPEQRKAEELRSIALSSEREQAIASRYQSNFNLIKETTEKINEFAAEDRIKMPEGIFVRYFLPMFAREEGMYPPDANEQWLKITKGGILHVDIVTDTGEVVKTVPPRYYRSMVTVRTKRDRISVFDAMETFKDLAVSSPKRALNYFNNVMNPPIEQSDRMKQLIEKYNTEMDDILVHYGKNRVYTSISEQEKVGEKVGPKIEYTEDDIL